MTIARWQLLLVLTLALPLNVMILAGLWHLSRAAEDAQRTSLQYTARSIAAAVDAKLDKYATLAQALAMSPALLQADLASFEAEARRAFAHVTDAWVLVADLHGRQLINTALQPGEPPPQSPEQAIAVQQRAAKERSVIVSDIWVGPVVKDWVAVVVVPILRNGEPVLSLAVTMRTSGFLELFNAQKLPQSWLAGIMDGQGRLVARVPDHARLAGSYASEDWRRVRGQEGTYQMTSLEGDVILNASARSHLSDWTVGVAVRKADLQAEARRTLRWMTLIGTVLSLVSLSLALAIARRIARPIEELRRRARDPLASSEAALEPATPEVRELWHTLERTAAERVQADGELRASEARLKLREAELSRAQRLARIGSFEVEVRDGEYTARRSPEYLLIHGLPPQSRSERREDWLARVHPEDRGRADAGLSDVIAGRASEYRTEYRIIRPSDGEIRWIRVLSHIERLHDGRLVRIFGTHSDVTEAKKAEAALRESERRMAIILESLPIGVALIDTEGRAVMANAVYKSYVPDKVPSKDRERIHLWEARHPDGRRFEHDEFAVARALRGERVWPGIECLYHGVEGGPVWTRVAALPYRDEAGAIVGATAVIIDIDREKTALEAHAEQQRLYKSVTDNASVGLLIMDDRQHCVFMNPAAEALTGYTLEDVQGRPLHDVVHHTRPDVSPYPLAECPIDRALPRNDREQGEEVFVHKDGQFYPVAFTASPIRDQSGRPIGTIIEVQDISARRLADAAVARLASIVTSSSDAIVSKTRDGVVTSWNEGATRLFGYTEAEMLGQSIRRIVPADRQAEEDRFLKLIAEGRLIEHYDTVRISKSGRAVDVSVTVSPIRSADGRVIGASKIVRDISERKAAERALRESEERLRLALSAGRLGAWQLDVAGMELTTSSQNRANFGRGEAAPFGFEQFRDALHPDDRERVLAAVADAVARGGDYEAEYRCIWPDGSTHWIDSRGRAFAGSDGRTARLAGVTLDITQRKQREEQIGMLLREVNHRAKNMLGLVQAIAAQMAAEPPADFVQHFSERIRGLAASQDLLIKSEWQGVDLDDLVRSQLSHFAHLIESRIKLEGPHLRISAEAAQTLGMALHELATNAGKYGALSCPGGEVAIAWSAERIATGPARFHMSWTERGGPPVRPPERPGFGTIVIETRRAWNWMLRSRRNSRLPACAGGLNAR